MARDPWVLTMITPPPPAAGRSLLLAAVVLGCLLPWWGHAASLVGVEEGSTAVLAVGLDSQVTVSWTPTAGHGAGTVCAVDPPSPAVVVGESSCHVFGLVNGVPVSVLVVPLSSSAVELPAYSPYAIVSATPMAAPDPPVALSAVLTPGGFRAVWSHPTSDQGSVVRSYNVSVRTGGSTMSSATVNAALSTSHTFTGLDAGEYTVQCVAVNAVGASVPATASVSVVDLPTLDVSGTVDLRDPLPAYGAVTVPAYTTLKLENLYQYNFQSLVVDGTVSCQDVPDAVTIHAETIVLEASARVYCEQLVVFASSMTVKAGSVISVDGGGLEPTADGIGGGRGQPTDTVQTGSGGAHGGMGGYPRSTGRPFGSMLVPTSLGGAGTPRGNADQVIRGVRGGGSVAIHAANLAISGTISASGTDGIDSQYWAGAGGAGGSIFINVSQALTLDGTLKANGGVGHEFTHGTNYWSGGGGGGRIALHYPLASRGAVAGSVSTFGGGVYQRADSLNYRGGAGTVVHVTPTPDGGSYVKLIVDNGGNRAFQTNGQFSCTRPGPLESLSMADEISVVGGGLVLVTEEALPDSVVTLATQGSVATTAPGFVLDLSQLGLDITLTGCVIFEGANSTLRTQAGATLTIAPNGCLRFEASGGTLTGPTNLIVEAGGALTQFNTAWPTVDVLAVSGMVISLEPDFLTPFVVKTRVGITILEGGLIGGQHIHLVSQEVVLHTRSRVTAEGRGYIPSDDGRAAGVPASTVQTGSGGAHGGLGGKHRTGAQSFGEVCAPISPGGAGSANGDSHFHVLIGVRGGGVVRITAHSVDLQAGSLIIVDGEVGLWYTYWVGAGGAGGSIFIETTSLFAAGSLSAAGGNGQESGYGGTAGAGGGGRVALVYSAGSSTFAPSFSVDVSGGGVEGHLPPYGSAQGGAGTVCHVTHEGVTSIRVDNGGAESADTTLDLSPVSVDDLTLVGEVHVTLLGVIQTSTLTITLVSDVDDGGAGTLAVDGYTYDGEGAGYGLVQGAGWTVTDSAVPLSVVWTSVLSGPEDGGWPIAGTVAGPVAVTHCVLDGSVMLPATTVGGEFSCVVPPGSKTAAPVLGVVFTGGAVVATSGRLAYRPNVVCSLLPGVATTECDVSTLGNGVCDPACNVLACAFDNRDCGDARVYVAATAGNDSSTTASQGAPLATLGRAMELACTGFTTCTPIVLLPGAHHAPLTYLASVDVNISSAGGPGSANVTGDLYFMNCNVTIENVGFVDTTLTLDVCPTVDLRGVSLVATGPPGGIVVNGPSALSLADVRTLGVRVALNASNFAPCAPCLQSAACQLCTHPPGVVAVAVRRSSLAVDAAFAALDITCDAGLSVDVSVTECEVGARRAVSVLGTGCGAHVYVAHTVINATEAFATSPGVQVAVTGGDVAAALSLDNVTLLHTGVLLSAMSAASVALDVRDTVAVSSAVPGAQLLASSTGSVDVTVVDFTASFLSASAVDITVDTAAVAAVTLHATSLLQCASSGSGGGIHIDMGGVAEANVLLSGVVCDASSAAEDGGCVAVFVRDTEASHTAVVTLSNSNMVSSVAGVRGGGVMLLHDGPSAAVFLVTHVGFASTQAALAGGCVAVVGSGATSVHLASATFASCGSLGAGGGAVHVTGAGTSLSAVDVVFANSFASGGGGDMGVAGGAKATLSLCTHTHGSDPLGGALFVTGVASSLTTTHGSIQDSSAYLGGAVYAASGTLSMSHMVVARASASSGGAVYASRGATVTVSHTTVSACTADDAGAGIHATSTANVALHNVSVASCRAGQQGGAAVFTAGAVANVSLSTFRNNVAPAAGGLMLDGGAVLYVVDTWFEDNSDGLSVADAGRDAGALVCRDASLATVLRPGFGGGNNPFSFSCSGCDVGTWVDPRLPAPTCLSTPPVFESVSFGAESGSGARRLGGLVSPFPTVGGTELSVPAANLGVAAGAAAWVVFGDVVVPATVVDVATSPRIVFKSPPGVGTGLPLVPYIEGRVPPAGTNIVFSYSPPAVHTVTDPLPSAGGPVSLTGVNFGGDPSVVTVSVQADGGSVADCRQVRGVNHTSATCDVQPGFGDVSVVVSVAGQVSTPHNATQTSGVALVWHTEVFHAEALPSAATSPLPLNATALSATVWNVLAGEPATDGMLGAQCSVQVVSPPAFSLGGTRRRAVEPNGDVVFDAAILSGSLVNTPTPVTVSLSCELPTAEVLGPLTRTFMVPAVELVASPGAGDAVVPSPAVGRVAAITPPPLLTLRRVGGAAFAGLPVGVTCTADVALPVGAGVSVAPPALASRPLSAAGDVSFSGLGLTGAHGVDAVLTYACTWPNNQPVVAAAGHAVRLHALSVTMSSWSPPPTLPPSSAFRVIPFDPPPRVMIVADNASAVTDAPGAVTCSLTTSDAQLVPAAGTSALVDVSGTAAFPGVGAIGDLGAALSLRVTCTWVDGVVLPVVEFGTHVAHLALSWTAQPAATVIVSSEADTLPLTPAPSGTLHVADSASTVMSGQTGVQCDVTLAGGGGDTNVAIQGTTSHLLSSAGVVSWGDVGLTGAANAVATLEFACVWHGGERVAAPPVNVTLEGGVLSWTSPPPSSVLPSYSQSSIVVPLQPAPRLRLLTSSGRTVSTVGKKCRAVLTAAAPPGSKLVQLTPAGALLQGVAEADLDAAGSAAFEQLGVEAPLGSAMNVSVECEFVNGDTVLALLPVVVANASVLHVTPPPPTFASAEGVEPPLRVALVDPATGGRVSGDLVGTRCEVTAEAAAPGTLVAVELSSSVADADLTGEALFGGLVATAPPGSLWLFTVACTRGREALPPLPFRMDAAECHPGQRVDPSRCVTCSAGTWSPWGNWTTCEACPAGYYAPGSGATACTPCTFGHAAAEGSPTCEPCSPGLVASAAADSCELCPMGFYNPDVAARECRACPLGTFLDAAGATSVAACISCTSSLGAAATTLDVATPSPTQCLCQSGSLLLPGSDGFTCGPCPAGGDCSTPGATLGSLVVLPGYWRATNTSVDVLECVTEAACPGGAFVNGSVDGQCTPGHTGAMCDVCLDSHSRTATGNCVPCEESSVTVKTDTVVLLAAVVGGAVLVAVGAAVLRRRLRRTFAKQATLYEEEALPASEQRQAVLRDLLAMPDLPWYASEWLRHMQALACELDVLDGAAAAAGGDGDDVVVMEHNTALHAGDAPRGGVEDPPGPDGGDAAAAATHAADPAVLEAEFDEYRAAVEDACSESHVMVRVKIVLGFIQVMTSLETTTMPYPDTFTSFLSSFNLVNLDFLNLFSFGCVWQPTFYTSLLFSTLAPLAVVACVIVLHVAVKAARRLSGRPSHTSAWAFNVALFVSFLCYPGTSRVIFQTFRCLSFDDGTSRLAVDLSLDCETGTHAAYMLYAGVMVLVYPLGIPVVYVVLLARSRRSLSPWAVHERPVVDFAPPKDAATSAWAGGRPWAVITFPRELPHARLLDFVERVGLAIGATQQDVTKGSLRALPDGSRCLALRRKERGARGPPAKARLRRLRRVLSKFVGDWRPTSDSTARDLHARDVLAANAELRFLYGSFKPRMYAFELVEMLRKLLLTSVIGLFFNGSAFEAAIAVLVSAVALGVQLRLEPYTEPSDNRLAAAQHVNTALTFLVGLMLMTDVTGGEEDASGTTATAFGVLLVTLTVSIIVFAVALSAYENIVVRWIKAGDRFPHLVATRGRCSFAVWRLAMGFKDDGAVKEESASHASATRWRRKASSRLLQPPTKSPTAALSVYRTLKPTPASSSKATPSRERVSFAAQRATRVKLNPLFSEHSHAGGGGNVPGVVLGRGKRDSKPTEQSLR